MNHYETCCGASPWLKLYTKIEGPQWSTYVPYCIKQQLLTRWLISSQFIFSESRITYDSIYQTHLNGTPIFRVVFMTFSCQPYTFTPIILFCYHGISWTIAYLALGKQLFTQIILFVQDVLILLLNIKGILYFF